ncbi:hypothetical protein [Celeribacter baekdonensis]|uniref:Uncharacterized protein n=1 Tax=Celeribacter baekdonensis TaxID=875171 RepID=A0A2R4M1P5_9RHOB|nr:hypothetical protein [Celeribacter baekdonensis]AVW90982.1 hypothetical protein DA792_07700 [Celeribacter baekdonensis]
MAAPTYATRTYTVPAGGSLQIARMSDFLTALEASAPFKVSFDNQPRTDFEAGLTYNTENGFQLVEIINEDVTALTVKLGFGRGDIKDSRLTLGAATINTRESVPNNIDFQKTTIVGGSIVNIPYDANRYEILIRRVDTGAANLVIQKDGGTGGRSFSIENGDILSFKTSAGFEMKSYAGPSSVEIITTGWA